MELLRLDRVNEAISQTQVLLDRLPKLKGQLAE